MIDKNYPNHSNAGIVGKKKQMFGGLQNGDADIAAAISSP